MRTTQELHGDWKSGDIDDEGYISGLRIRLSTSECMVELLEREKGQAERTNVAMFICGAVLAVGFLWVIFLSLDIWEA